MEWPLDILVARIQYCFQHLCIPHQECVHSQGRLAQFGCVIGTSVHSVHFFESSLECLHIARAVCMQCSVERCCICISCLASTQGWNGDEEVGGNGPALPPVYLRTDRVQLAINHANGSTALSDIRGEVISLGIVAVAKFICAVTDPCGVVDDALELCLL